MGMCVVLQEEPEAAPDGEHEVHLTKMAA
jgi:hypothetical protein